MKKNRKPNRIIAIALTIAVTMTMCFSLTSCGSKTSSDADIANYTSNINGEIAKEVSHTLAFDEKYFNEGDASGFRTVGSDADHVAAEYIKEQFEAVGLETEIVPVKVDKWVTGDKHLNVDYVEKGEKKSIEIGSAEIVSYMSNGTATTVGNDKGAGKLSEKQWKNMQIVDVGTGGESGYYDEDGKEIDVKGKIVLAGVNQNNDSWIDAPYEEAYARGAAAIVVYQRTPSEDDEGVGDGLLGVQNGENEWDTVNVQDICAGDYIPCAGISPKSAAAIRNALEKGEDVNADLLINSELTPGGGESWEVVGKLAGTGNTGQQIVYGGHYDKYFYGLNDDCTAVGLITGIAASMVKSGYKPYNDIYFVATGAEEWGESGAQYDWAAGTWQMISKAKPEWQGTTLSFINFEMPAIKSGQTKGYVQSTLEMASFLKNYSASDALEGVKAYYKDGVDVEEYNDDQVYMSDCISYQTCGVPVIINKPDFDSPVDEPMASESGDWNLDRYHTKYDDDTTYSQELMDYNIAYYGTIGITMDKQPALELDCTERVAQLKDAVTGLDDYVDADTIKKYNDAVAEYEKAMTELAAKAEKLNESYSEASEEEKAEIKAEGTELNSVSLAAFKALEADIMGFAGSVVMPYSVTGSEQLLALENIISMLKDKKNIEDVDALLGSVFGLWGGAEYGALNFGKPGYISVIDGMNGTRHSPDPAVEGTSTDDWSTGRRIKAIDTYDATRSIAEQIIFAEKAPADCNFEKAINIYSNAVNTLAKQTGNALKKETKALEKIAKNAN